MSLAVDPEGEHAARLASLYTPRFFRRRFEITPTLLQAVSSAARRAPRLLPCLYIWGVHEKPAPDSHDEDSLAYLQSLLERIGQRLHVTAVVQMVLADSHGDLNEVPHERSAPYARAVTLRMQELGWDVHRMSDLWREAGITRARIDELARSLDVAADAPRLLLFARRHYRGASAETGAQRYLAARLLERPVLSERFRNHVLLTPVEPALDAIQPDLPRLHVWTRKKGCSAKPWFSAAH